MFLRIENSTPTIDVDAPVWSLPFSIDKANNDLWFAFMACKLDWFNQNLNGAHSQHCSSNTYVLVDQMRLYHAHGEYLVEIIESQNHHSMVHESVNVQPHIIKAKRNRFNHIIRMLIYIFKKLFDVGVSTWVQIRIAHIHNYIFKVIFFLLPF